MIKSSTDWNEYEMALLSKTRGLSYEHEVKRMIENIRAEITELSKAEVLARRGQTHRAKEVLSKVNNDIDMVEEYLLVAALLG